MSIMTKLKLEPPKSWINADKHYKDALESEWYKKLVILQDEINHSSWGFFREKGIRTVSLPITTGSVTSPMGLGSDSLPVKVNLEGIDTYLSDSMQFHLEYLLRYLEDGVHYIMPSFRGEQADERHLCQFYHSESEIKGGIEDVIELVNEYIYQLCVDLLNRIPDVIEEFAGSLDHVKKIIQKRMLIDKITFEEAVVLLEDNPEYIQHHPEGFRTITSEGEKKLIQDFGGMLWVSHYDYISVPFYQAVDETGKYAMNADLLFGIGEVVGAGERHTTGKEVRDSLKLHELDEKEYEWYLYMKENFPIKTAGFGMGVERFLLWLTQQNDIRDFQVIPRFNGVNITP
ncbi:asparagine synthetase A [Peribacillus psychrosaccharolyticus]|uniref:asparagine synthetase A n=2 Tax=Peribacillus psychrosaccharolyticus TaxID=1407 RepID=UPI0002F022DC|nr:asparagine synthetase A [Peribacillus psychrosaccharolyticus]MED3746577.1 asparagine synthetase A [Peribacillus psychrosaccharolyticus]